MSSSPPIPPSSELTLTELPGRGRALVTKRAVPAGCVLISEKPSVAVLLPGRGELGRHVADVSTGCGIDITDSGSVRDQYSRFVQSHPPPPTTPTTPINEFFSYACSTDATLILAGRVVASGAANDVLKLFESVDYSTCFADDEKELVKTTLSTSHALLLKANVSNSPPPSLDEWSNVVGAVHTNAVCISINSGLREWLEGLVDSLMGGEEVEQLLNENGKKATDLPAVIDELERAARKWCERNGEEFEECEIETEVIEGEDGGDSDSGENDNDHPSDSPLAKLASVFNSLPEIEATGLFPAICMINHSCDPNVAIEYRGDDETASVVALVDIAAGAEVCHSYVSVEELPCVFERRAHIEQQHGFVCNCVLCSVCPCCAVDDRGVKPDPHCCLLIRKMEEQLPGIVESLREEGRKVGCWIWWAFPTSKAGDAEPSPPTKVSTLDQCVYLIAHAPREWRLVLEVLVELIEGEEGDMSCVIPTIDHPRIKYFVALFGELEDVGWMEGVVEKFRGFLQHENSEAEDRQKRRAKKSRLV